MSLFVLSCKDGWVNIMYDGLDAVGVDQQVNVREAAEIDTRKNNYFPTQIKSVKCFKKNQANCISI